MPLFHTLIQVSLTGGLMVAAILLARPLLKRLRTHTILLSFWLCAAALLLIPFRPASPISLYNTAGGAPSVADVFTVGGSMPVATSSGAVQTVAPAGSAVSPWLVIWLAGAAILLLIMTASALRLRRKFRDAVPVACEFPVGWRRRVRVSASANCAGPVTFGVLRPRIVIPATMANADAQQMEYILMHEYEHIRGLDALVNLLWMAVLCVHWFNPLVWAGWIFLRRDMESRCDAHVLKRTGPVCRAGYAQTLLDMVPVRRGAFSPFAFSASPVGGRIRGVLAYRPATRRALCGALAVVIACLLLLATNPVSRAIAAQIEDQAANAGIISTTATADSGYLLYQLTNYDPAGPQTGKIPMQFVQKYSFATLDYVLNYLTKTYVNASDVAGIFTPENFTPCGYYASMGNNTVYFTAQELTFSIHSADGATYYYQLIDKSTYQPVSDAVSVFSKIEGPMQCAEGELAGVAQPVYVVE